jgi:hypothetical protein
VAHQCLLSTYWTVGSFFAVGRALKLRHQTVQRCVDQNQFQPITKPIWWTSPAPGHPEGQGAGELDEASDLAITASSATYDGVMRRTVVFARSIFVKRPP